MNNKTMRTLLRQIGEQASQERRTEKLILIEDIIKAKRNLFGMGCAEYSQSVVNPDAEFDELYDLGIGILTKIMRGLEQEQTSTATLRMIELRIND